MVHRVAGLGQSLLGLGEGGWIEQDPLVGRATLSLCLKPVEGVARDEFHTSVHAIESRIFFRQFQERFMGVTVSVLVEETVDGYVDRGASLSIFMSTIAYDLGININDGKPHYILAGDGGYILTYLHKITARIGDTSFPATVAFSDHLGADAHR